MSSSVPFDRRKETIILNTRRCLLFGLLVAVCLHAGCATRKPLTLAHGITPPPLETVEDAKGLLLEDYGRIDFVKVGGTIEIRLHDEGYRRQASFVLMLQRPDRLRMRAYRALTPTLFELVVDGQTCWLHTPSERTAYLSEDCGPLLGTGNGVAFSAAALVAALVVVPDFEALRTAAASLLREDGFVGLVVEEDAGARKEIWIDPMTGLAARQLLVGPDEEVEVDIAYIEHAVDVDMDAVIPTETHIDFPRLRASMLIRIDDFRADPDMPADAFDFSPPQNTRILDPASLNGAAFLR